MYNITSDLKIASVSILLSMTDGKEKYKDPINIYSEQSNLLEKLIWDSSYK